MSYEASSVPAEQIESAIFRIRGLRVMLDEDLAALYEVKTSALVRAVKRNMERFPDDFMFQLTEEEYQSLRWQIGISNERSGRHYLPYAFTEQGIVMLSSVLRSSRAIQVNIEILRSSARLCNLSTSNTELAQKLEELEKKTDARFQIVFDAIHQMMPPLTPNQHQVGRRQKEDNA